MGSIDDSDPLSPGHGAEDWALGQETPGDQWNAKILSECFDISVQVRCYDIAEDRVERVGE